jgi:hypothetical protein
MVSEVNLSTTPVAPRVETRSGSPRTDTQPANASALPAAETAGGGGASPRIQVDPTAGVILQFLDNRGEVATQSPSFAAVAYLKAGLTREGFGKDPPETKAPAITA